MNYISKKLSPIILIVVCLSLTSCNTVTGHYSTGWNLESEARNVKCQWKSPDLADSTFLCKGMKDMPDSTTEYYIYVFTKQSDSNYLYQKHLSQQEPKIIAPLKQHPLIDFIVGASYEIIYLHKLSTSSSDPNMIKYAGVYKLKGGYIGSVNTLIALKNQFLIAGSRNDPNLKLFFYELGHQNLENGESHVQPSNIEINPLKIYSFASATVSKLKEVRLIESEAEDNLVILFGKVDYISQICRFSHDFLTVSDKDLTAFTSERCADLPTITDQIQFYSLPSDNKKFVIFSASDQKIWSWNSNDSDAVTDEVLITGVVVNSENHQINRIHPYPEQDDLFIINFQALNGEGFYKLSTNSLIGYFNEEHSDYDFDSRFIVHPITKEIISTTTVELADEFVVQVMNFNQGTCSETCGLCHSDSLIASECFTCRRTPMNFDYPGQLTGGTCSCPTGCDSCSGHSSNECLSCSPGRYLENNYCKPQCAEGKTTAPENRVCEICNPSCLECSLSANTCSVCEFVEILHEGQCLTECPSGFLLNETRDACNKCEDDCKSCVETLSFCVECANGQMAFDGQCELSTFLDFKLTQSIYEYPEYDIVLDLVITKGRINFEFSPYLKRHFAQTAIKIILDLPGSNTKEKEDDLEEGEIPVVEEKPEVFISKLFWTPRNSISLGLRFIKQPLNSEKGVLVFEFIHNFLFQDDEFQNPILIKEERLDINIAPGIEHSLLDTTEDFSNLLAASVKWIAYSVQTLALAFVFLIGDPCFSFFRFSQVATMLSRLRYLDVDHGKLLNQFFFSMNDQINLSEPTTSDLNNYEGGTYAKFSIYQSKLLLIKFSWKCLTESPGLVLYLLSWIIKIITIVKLWELRRGKNLTVKMAPQFFKKVSKYIGIHQKIHFFLYQMNILNLTFYGLRTIYHTAPSDFIFKRVLTTSILFFFAIFDTIQLAEASFAARNNYKIWLIQGKGGEGKAQKQKLEFVDNNTEDKEGESEDKVEEEPTIQKWISRKLVDKKSIQQGKISSSVLQIKSSKFGLPTRSKKSITPKNAFSSSKSLKKKNKNKLIKIVDSNRTFDQILMNPTLAFYVFTHIKLNMNLKNSLVYTENLTFLLKMIIYQVILVGLSKNPMLAILVLITIELLYLVKIIWTSLRLKFFKFHFTWITRAVQSLCMIIFLITSMISLLQWDDIPVTLQKVVFYLILTTLGLEFVYLLINLGLSLRQFIKTIKGKEEKIFEKKPKIFYKWIRVEDLSIIMNPFKKHFAGGKHRSRTNFVLPFKSSKVNLFKKDHMGIKIKNNGLKDAKLDTEYQKILTPPGKKTPSPDFEEIFLK